MVVVVVVDRRHIALNFYELVSRKGINFLNVSSQRSTVLVSLFSSQSLQHDFFLTKMRPEINNW